MKIDKEAEKWVNKTLEGLTLKEKIGQLLLPILSADSANPLTVGEMVEKYNIAGGHYFGGNKEQSFIFTEALQAKAKIPLLITGDLDRGGGDRIKEGTLFQCQMALGAADSEDLAYKLGKAIAVENLAVGYNWTFSPIVDICAIRDHLRLIACVGEDPKQIARITVAEIKGLQDNGMAACAKHFPGDGYDDRDQHITTSVNTLSEKEWWKKSGYTFQTAIDSGVWTIMNSCIAMPAMDKECGDPKNPRPVNISRYMTTGILREKMGFEGVIVTDALNMGGVAIHERRFERYLQSFEAGNDLLLFVFRVGETVAYFEKAVKEKRITEAQIDSSVRRVLTLKAKIGLHNKLTKEEKEKRLEVFKNSPFKKDAIELAEKSITLLTDSRNIIPLKLKKGATIASVLITNRETDFNGSVFNDYLKKAGYKVVPILNPDAESMYSRVENKEFDLVITSLFFPVQWGWITPRMHGPYVRSLMSGYYIAHPEVKSIFVSFDSPGRLYEISAMDPFFATYGGSPFAQEAVAKAILGEIAVSGKAPVSLNGFFKAGDGLQRKKLK